MIESETQAIVSARYGTEIKVVTFAGLMVDAAREAGATMIFRGLRDGTDLDYEMQMSGMNGAMAPGHRYGLPARQPGCAPHHGDAGAPDRDDGRATWPRSCRPRSRRRSRPRPRGTEGLTGANVAASPDCGHKGASSPPRSYRSKRSLRLKTFLASLALALLTLVVPASAQAPKLDPANTLIIELKSGKVYDPASARPRPKARRARQDARQPGLL